MLHIVIRSADVDVYIAGLRERKLLTGGVLQ